MRLRSLLVAVLVLGGCGVHSGLTADERTFVTSMVPHHRLGIAMVDHAIPRVDDVETRRMVFEMSGYHVDELHEMDRHLAHDGSTEADRFPGWIDPIRLDSLADRSGSAYDVGWLALMVEHHQGAIAMTQKMSDAGDDFRSLARRIASVQGDEVVRMVKIIRRLCAAGVVAPECG